MDIGITKWHPTGQIAWVKNKNGTKALCQVWMEMIEGAKGPRPTGTAQWREVPTIDSADDDESDESSKSNLII